MKKLTFVLLSFFLVASLGAQERRVKRIFFNYENGNAHTHSVGDTLTGGTVAHSADTIYFSGLDGDGNIADQIIISVTKDTDFVATQGKIDTTLLHIQRGAGGFNFYSTLRDTLRIRNGLYVATDVLGFVTSEFLTEFRTDEGQLPSSGEYRLIIDNGLVAATDSTSYRVAIFGIFNNN